MTPTLFYTQRAACTSTSSHYWPVVYVYKCARQATYNGNKSHECIDLDFGRVVYSVMPFSDTFINTNGGRLIGA